MRRDVTPRGGRHPGPAAVCVNPAAVAVGRPVNRGVGPPVVGLVGGVIVPAAVALQIAGVVDDRARHVVASPGVLPGIRVERHPIGPPGGKIVGVDGVERCRARRRRVDLGVRLFAGTEVLGDTPRRQRGPSVVDRQPDPSILIDVDAEKSRLRQPDAARWRVDAQNRQDSCFRLGAFDIQASRPQPHDGPGSIRRGAHADEVERRAGVEPCHRAVFEGQLDPTVFGGPNPVTRAERQVDDGGLDLTGGCPLDRDRPLEVTQAGRYFVVGTALRKTTDGNQERDEEA